MVLRYSSPEYTPPPSSETESVRTKIDASASLLSRVLRIVTVTNVGWLVSAYALILEIGVPYQRWYSTQQSNAAVGFDGENTLDFLGYRV